MDQIIHTVRTAKWKDIILQCQNRPAGISVKQWMAENQISEKSYYYWQRKLRKAAYVQMNNSPAVQVNSEVSFAEIRIPEPIKSVSDIISETIKPTAVIKTATMMIALSNDITDNLLSRILQEVSHA
jgi:putative transposase